MKIQNLAANAMTCLVFRIAYKVKYTSNEKGQSDEKDIIREFILGRNPFFLNFSGAAIGFIKDRATEFELNMCPELRIINDLLWNVNESDA